MPRQLKNSFVELTRTAGMKPSMHQFRIWLRRTWLGSGVMRIWNLWRGDYIPLRIRRHDVHTTVQVCEECMLLSGMTFDDAVSWNTDTQSSVSASLTAVGRPVAFSVNLSSLGSESFLVDLPPGGSRRITLWNELGQLQAYSDSGRLDFDARWARLHTNGQHFVTVEALNAAGQSDFNLQFQAFANFSSQRDVSLFFMDFNGETSAGGYDPAPAYTRPEFIPLLTQLFESQYDIYDIDVTNTNPGPDVPRVWQL